METNAVIAYFISWENHSRDTIDFKKIYVDMADDLVAGLVLSQIVYWHLPGDSGVTRLRVDKDGHKWIAKKREDWWKEIRVSAKQLDRALEILEEKSLIVTGLYGFAGTPTKHVRINWEGFLSAWQAILTDGENATFLPLGNLHFDQRVNSNTENTTETTNYPASTPEQKKSIAGRMLAKRNLPPAPLGKTDEQKESERRQPLSSLEAYLAQLSHARHGVLPIDAAQKLTQRVIGETGNDYQSPAELWNNNEKFREYVDARFDYWLKKTKQDKAHLVNLIRMYEQPQFGWLAYWETEDDIDVPAKPYTPNTDF